MLVFVLIGSVAEMDWQERRLDLLLTRGQRGEGGEGGAGGAGGAGGVEAKTYTTTRTRVARPAVRLNHRIK